MTSTPETTTSGSVTNAGTGWFRRMGLAGTIFAAGLLLGLFFFLSREILWSQVLQNTLGHLPRTSWTWQSVGDRGVTHITYNGFNLLMHQTRLFFPELTINLGASTPVTMHAKTGPNLLADLGWDRNIRISGAVDIQKLLPELRLQGIVDAEGYVDWRTWNEPPYRGEMVMQAPGLLIFAPGIMTTNLRLQASLEGNQLNLTSIQADGPIALTAEAQVLLDWRHLENSTYTIKGTLVGMGGMPFSASGRLGGIWGK
jgi:hypothetical protein